MSTANVQPATHPSFVMAFIDTSSLGFDRALQLWNLAWAFTRDWCAEPVFTDEVESCTFAMFKCILCKA